MSIREVTPPQLSQTPIYSLEEARAKGLNLRKACTCAVPLQGESGAFIIRGCPKGEHCAREGFGTARFGSFGPNSDEPGTGGGGVENVPYYHYDVGSSTEVEGFMPCYIWMQTMMDKYDSQRKTGDVLEVLGREGKTTVTILETLPSDRNGNKPGSGTSMVESSKQVLVPEFRKSKGGASTRLEHALAIRANRDRTQAIENRERMGPVIEPQDAEENEIAADVLADAEAAGEEAAEMPGVLDGVENMEFPTSSRQKLTPSRRHPR